MSGVWSYPSPRVGSLLEDVVSPDPSPRGGSLHDGAVRRPHALVAFLEERADWSFGYGPEPGTHDCARFCGAGVKAVTGADPLDSFAGSWTTRAGARRVIAAHGGLASAVGEVMQEIAPTMAQRGDVGMTAAGTLVLIEGDTIVGPASPVGLERLPRSALTKAWTA